MGNIVSKIEALHSAILKDKLDEVKEIMEDEKGNDNPTPGSERVTMKHPQTGFNALMIACLRDADPEKCVLHLLHHRKDFDEQLNDKDPVFDMTPLHHCATHCTETSAHNAYEQILTRLFVRSMELYNFDEEKSKHQVRTLLSSKARFGWTPCHCAAYFYDPQGHDEMIAVLILFGSDLLSETHFGETPADLIRSTPNRNSLTVGHVPFRYDENDISLCKQTLINRKWALHGQVCLSFFTDRYPYILKPSSPRQEAIDEFVKACKYGDFDRILSYYMADLGLPSPSKAATRPNNNTINNNISFHELLFAKNSYGNTGIIVAASFGQVDVCRFLLAHCGNDPSTRKNRLLFFTNDEGWTPLLCAIKRRHTVTARFFLNFNFGLHALEQLQIKEKTQGFNALHLASRDDNPGMIEMCLDYAGTSSSSGAAAATAKILDERDHQGNNCLHLCFQPGQKSPWHPELRARGIPTCEGDYRMRDNVIQLLIARGIPFEAKTKPSKQDRDLHGAVPETADDLAKRYGATPAVQLGLFAGDTYNKSVAFYNQFRQQYNQFCKVEEQQEYERQQREGKKRLDQCVSREMQSRIQMVQEEENAFKELSVQHPERERLDRLEATRDALDHLVIHEVREAKDDLATREQQKRLSLMMNLQAAIQFEQKKIDDLNLLISVEENTRNDLAADAEIRYQQVLISEQADTESIKRNREKLLRDILEYPNREADQRQNIRSQEQRELKMIFGMMEQFVRNEYQRLERLLLENQRREVDERQMIWTNESNERQSLWYFHRELKHAENEEKKKKNPLNSKYYDSQFKQYQNTWQQQNNALDDNNDFNASKNANDFLQMNNNNNNAAAGTSVNDIGPSTARCFSNGVSEIASTEECLRLLLSLRTAPPGREDLQSKIPHDSDFRSLQASLRGNIPRVKSRPQVKSLMQHYGLNEEDIKALFLYKLESPYPVYLWLNGWLMGDQRSTVVKEKVAPFFIRLYRAMEKLPKVSVRANRAVRVKQIASLRQTFDNYKTVCREGNVISFWSFSSFSSEDSIINNPFYVGKPDEDAIVYSAGSLLGVDMQPFRPDSMAAEAEILPMCPSIFEVQTAVKFGHKLMIGVKQMSHEDYSYLQPKHY